MNAKPIDYNGDEEQQLLDQTPNISSREPNDAEGGEDELEEDDFD